ncbi:hypothetical protein JAAARDRAFT_165252 [Jaapia argillacea MUCL 33604]|uniref:Uncharacterized protein n=1 Tax=Jaapia argillacea MUCL 33604 TaxID=933084 RepID=A0A067P558_9AGAM|nr:hypothetical protein JAAARDRAFT_165252 [Jaapia argillacea MUCL 33604]
MQQAQAEGVCLKYPENIGIHPSISYENAVQMLLRALQMAAQVPFVWGYIDKPVDGQGYLLFIPPQYTFPNDGVRYLDQDVRYTIPAGPGRELEVIENKHGFIPNSQDTAAYRLRKRFRLSRGGHPQLILVHYSRGQPMPIVPSLLNQPVRAYPLRPINEPPVYVLGEKTGQQVFANASQPQVTPQKPGGSMGGYGGAGPSGIGIPGANPQAMLAQQNANMEALDRRAQRERSGSMGNRQQQAQNRMEEEDSGDEADQLSTRTLALTRYKRNHEWMNEVFMYAAFGDKNPPPKPHSYSKLFDKSQLSDKASKLTAEIEELKARAAARKEARSRVDVDDDFEGGDVSMDTLASEGVAVS